jgi:hypothetical protein
MSSTFHSLVPVPVAVGSSGSGTDSTLIARSLESRKQGGGPTAALGLGTGASVYGDRFKVTAADGLIVPPLFVLPGVAAAAAVTLDVTKSGATYFIQGGTYANTVTLRLPAQSVAQAGFKARFRIVSDNLIGTAGVVVQQNDADANPELKGFVAFRSAIADGGGAVGGIVGDNISVGSKLIRFVAAPTATSPNPQSVRAAPGDWIEIESDGVSWHVTGSISAVGGIVYTA